MQHTILARFFPPQDPIDQQLHQLQKQGAGMARIAHFCATLLVVLFSAGSFVALGSDALHSILVQWQTTHQLDIPSAISLCVSTLMVLAMDVAMLSAAATLRLLASRRAEFGEMLLHIAVMAGVCALEAGTYWFMSWQYEHPMSFAAGALIAARAVSAPLLAVYLASRRVLPITSRDILSASEIAAGAGVLRDVAQASRDPDAPLARKMRLYNAAAVMTPADRHRLDGMITAVRDDSIGAITPTPLLERPESPLVRAQEGSGSPDNDRPPTGPGTPQKAPQPGPGVRTPPEPIPLRRPQPEKQRKVAARQRTKQNAEARVRSAWHPGITISQLERAAHVSRSTAHKWNRVLVGEQSNQSSEVAQ